MRSECMFGHCASVSVYGFHACIDIPRYQPGSLSISGPSQKLVDLAGPEKAAMVEGDSGDDFSNEGLETRPLRERFTYKMLLLPSCDIPTKTSGLIVYLTTAVVCESPPSAFRAGV